MSDGVVDSFASRVPSALALANGSNLVGRLARSSSDGYMLQLCFGCSTSLWQLVAYQLRCPFDGEPRVVVSTIDATSLRGSLLDQPQGLWDQGVTS